MKRKTIKELEAELSELRALILAVNRRLDDHERGRPGSSIEAQTTYLRRRYAYTRGIEALIPTRKTRCFGGVPCGPNESCSGCES